MQRLLHAQQLIPLALQHLRHWYTSPFRDHLSNLLLSHLVSQQLFLGLLLGPSTGQLLFQLWNNAVLNLRHLLQIPGAMGSLQIHLSLLELGFDMGSALHRSLFRFPYLFQVGKLLLQFCNIFLKFGLAFFRGCVLILLHRLTLNF